MWPMRGQGAGQVVYIETSTLNACGAGKRHLTAVEPDGLRVHEIVHPIVAELAPVAALLDAADRHALIRYGEAVDERAAGFHTSPPDVSPGRDWSSAARR